jgi:hypothetical protein
MENKHCAQCREAIGANERRVRLVRADMDFHADCWAALHVTMQQDYELRTQDGGIVALLVPYHRTQVSAWLPSAEEDAAGVADAVAAADALVDEAAEVAEVEPLSVAS